MTRLDPLRFAAGYDTLPLPGETEAGNPGEELGQGIPRSGSSDDGQRKVGVVVNCCHVPPQDTHRMIGLLCLTENVPLNKPLRPTVVADGNHEYPIPAASEHEVFNGND